METETITLDKSRMQFSMQDAYLHRIFHFLHLFGLRQEELWTTIYSKYQGKNNNIYTRSLNLYNSLAYYLRIDVRTQLFNALKQISIEELAQFEANLESALQQLDERGFSSVPVINDLVKVCYDKIITRQGADLKDYKQADYSWGETVMNEQRGTMEPEYTLIHVGEWQVYDAKKNTMDDISYFESREQRCMNSEGYIKIPALVMSEIKIAILKKTFQSEGLYAKYEKMTKDGWVTKPSVSGRVWERNIYERMLYFRRKMKKVNTIGTMGCLITAFADVLAYYGATDDDGKIVSPSDVEKTMDINENGQTGYIGKSSNMNQYEVAERYHYQYKDYDDQSKFREILDRRVSQNEPTIILYKNGNSTHFAVVTGLRLDEQGIPTHYIIDDPGGLSSNNQVRYLDRETLYNPYWDRKVTKIMWLEK